MDDIQAESELAIFTCVLAAALIGTAVGLLGLIWKNFERRFKETRLEEKQITFEVTGWLIIAVVLVGTMPSIISHWRPEWLTWAYYICVILYLGLMIIWGVKFKGKKRTKTKKQDIRPIAYLSAWYVLAIGIFWNSIALLGVIGTALHMNLGPWGPDNYGWGKLFLFIGVGYFGTGIVLNLIGYVSDKGERIKSLRSEQEEESGAKSEGTTSTQQ